MDGLVIFVLIAGVVIGLIAWGAHSAKMVRQRWSDFARQNGLEYSGGVSAGAKPYISGWYGRTHVTICTVTRGSGKSRHTYTQFHGHVNVPMPQGLNLSREGFFNRMGKYFGGQDVQLGDRQLDDAFLVKAHDVQGAQSLMRIPQVKQALLTFLARHANMQLNERHVVFEQNGVCSDMTRMKAAIDDLAFLSQTLEAGHNELSGAAGRPARAQTRRASKGALRPAVAAEVLQSREQAVATAAAAAEAAYRKMDGDLQLSLDQQARETAALKAEMERQFAASQAEHKRKAEALRVERERRAAEAREAREAAVSAAQTGNRTMAESAEARTPTEQREAGRLADAFHKLEQKMESAGAWRAEDVAALPSNLGADSGRSGEFNVGTSAKADPFNVKFELPKFEAPKFEMPKFDLPRQAADAAKVLSDKAARKIGGFDELVAALSDAGLFSGDRDAILAKVKERVFILKVEVERVERTFGFDLPDSFRDGRTIEGRVQGKEYRVAVRYPAAETSRIDRIAPGTVIEVQGSVTAWDDLFKKATLDSF